MSHCMGQVGAGEQIGRHSGVKGKRWAKRESRRKMRQAWRMFKEDAPTKRRFAGWED